MSDTNVQIEKQLDQLADLCCHAIRGDVTVPNEQSDQLLKSLLMSGLARKADLQLETEIESRVKRQCREPAMHRGGSLSSLCQQLQESFDELAKQESRQPDQGNAAKAANVSSATDA